MKLFLTLSLFISSFISAQTINKMILDEKSGKQMIVGICDRTAFTDTNFAWWYESGYNNYEINQAEIDTIKNQLPGNLSIIIIMGTWCSDSRREVPRFLKILDEIEFDSNSVRMISVDRKKQSEEIDLKDLKLELVPTIIFFKDGSEIGRIVETPKTTLEGDLKKILM